jgi:DNA-binding transcriptional LysR family regulator
MGKLRSVELRDLRALVAVMRSGSFTAAAAELGYTQSAVSQQVAALEQEVGHKLLQRRPVRATAAGLRLAEHASRILLRVDVARSELARLHDAAEVVRLDACPLAAPTVLADALVQIRRLTPSLQVRVRWTDTASALVGLAAGRVDVAMVDGITPADNPLALTEPGLVSAAALVEEPLVVALSEGHPLAVRAWLDLSMLVDAPWVVPPQLPRGTPVSIAEGPLVCDGTDLVAALSLVAAGLGAVLLPASTSVLLGGVVTVPLRDPPLVHRTEVLTLRSPPRVVEQLVAELRARGRMS